MDLQWDRKPCSMNRITVIQTGPRPLNSDSDRGCLFLLSSYFHFKNNIVVPHSLFQIHTACCYTVDGGVFITCILNKCNMMIVLKLFFPEGSKKKIHS